MAHRQTIQIFFINTANSFMCQRTVPKLCNLPIILDNPYILYSYLKISEWMAGQNSTLLLITQCLIVTHLVSTINVINLISWTISTKSYKQKVARFMNKKCNLLSKPETRKCNRYSFENSFQNITLFFYWILKRYIFHFLQKRKDVTWRTSKFNNYL